MRADEDGAAPSFVWFANVGTERTQLANIPLIFGMVSLGQNDQTHSLHSNAVSSVSCSLSTPLCSHRRGYPRCTLRRPRRSALPALAAAQPLTHCTGCPPPGRRSPGAGGVGHGGGKVALRRRPLPLHGPPLAQPLLVKPQRAELGAEAGRRHSGGGPSPAARPPLARPPLAKPEQVGLGTPAAAEPGTRAALGVEAELRRRPSSSRRGA